MSDDLLEWLDCPCSSEVCLPRTAKAHIEAQAAEIDYWKTEARNVRRELKSEQKQTDSAMDNYDAIHRRCEAQAAEIEKLREALRPFALAAEKGRAVYIGVAMAMKDRPELFSYSTAYIDAGRTTASSHLTWNDYDEARLAFLNHTEVGQPWLRTYDAHLKGTENAE